MVISSSDDVKSLMLSQCHNTHDLKVIKQTKRGDTTSSKNIHLMFPIKDINT